MTAPYGSGADMWHDNAERYGVITARVICIRYLNSQERTTDESEKVFCRELREAMTMERNFSGVRVYPYSRKLAELNGEEKQYDESVHVNHLCAGDIDAAIYACEYGDGTHDFADAFNALTAQYGLERVRFVLACEVRFDSVFGHYPDELYAWAREQYINENHGSYGVRTRPAVLGEFIAYMREADSYEKNMEVGVMSENSKTIQFITSDYKELFRIPDGGNIKITYPPGDGRGTITRSCKYLDDHHFQTLGRGGDVYHICQFAEIMERLGARYEPEVQLRWAEINPYSPGEEKFFTYNREEGNTCIGHYAGEFGSGGDRYFSSWQDRENDRNTPEFQAELHSAVYALRQDLLMDYNHMLSCCERHPEAMIDSGDTYKRYGFKLETDTRQYFVNCFFGEYARDARFITYAYDKAAPVKEQEQPASDKTSVSNIFSPMSDWCMSKDYNGAERFNDGSRPLMAETYIADIIISGLPDRDEVSIGVYPHGTLSDNYYEGQAVTKELACKIGEDIVKHINANADMSVQFGDGKFMRYFTELQLSNIRVQGPLIQEKDKTSVLNQIRDAQKAPKAPRKKKSPDKKKEGTAI